MKGEEAPRTPKIEIFGASPPFADAAKGDKVAPATNAAAAARACRRDIGAAVMVTADVEDVEHLSEVPAKEARNDKTGPVTKAGAILKRRRCDAGASERE